MMHTLRVHDVLCDRILVSRESARLLEQKLRTLLSYSEAAVPQGMPRAFTVDFEGVEGLAPSFIDELVLILNSIMRQGTDGPIRRLIFAHPPTRLSSKFEAIARGHSMSIRVLPDGSWELQGGNE